MERLVISRFSLYRGSLYRGFRYIEVGYIEVPLYIERGLLPKQPLLN